MDYLIRTYGKGKGLRPEESSPDRSTYDFWLHFAEGSAMTQAMMTFFFCKLSTAETATAFKKNVSHPDFQTNVNFMEEQLESGYFAGKQFSAADCQMSYFVDLMDVGGFIGEFKPHLASWLTNVHARPAYQRALGHGGRENYELSACKRWLV